MTNLKKIGGKLTGTTPKAVYAYLNDEAVSSVFFKPYKSPGNFFYKVGSVIAAPVIHTGFSACFALNAGFAILKAIGNLLLLNTASAKENAKEAGFSLREAGIMLVLAIASPFINLVDLIGSGVKSILPDSNAETEDEAPSYN